MPIKQAYKKGKIVVTSCDFRAWTTQISARDQGSEAQTPLEEHTHSIPPQPLVDFVAEKEEGREGRDRKEGDGNGIQVRGKTDTSAWTKSLQNWCPCLPAA